MRNHIFSKDRTVAALGSEVERRVVTVLKREMALEDKKIERYLSDLALALGNSMEFLKSEILQAIHEKEHLIELPNIPYASHLKKKRQS
jgi:hypothetical protein